MSTVVGIDGAKSGWVAVTLADGAFRGCAVWRTLDEIMAAIPDAAAFGVDIPIGFPEGTGVEREADLTARVFVGPRRSSVFPMPPRAVLEAESYAEANALSRRRYGKGISRQSYGLRAKILEVDRLAADPRVFEVHPEVSFRALKGDVLAYAKKSWNGMRERVRLLEGAGIRLPDDLPSVAVAADDILDAAVAAWSAERIARGDAGVLPELTGDRVGQAGSTGSEASYAEVRLGRIWY